MFEWNFKLYEQYKKGEIKQAAIREVIKKDKGNPEKYKKSYSFEMSETFLDGFEAPGYVFDLKVDKLYKMTIEEI